MAVPHWEEQQYAESWKSLRDHLLGMIERRDQAKVELGLQKELLGERFRQQQLLGAQEQGYALTRMDRGLRNNLIQMYAMRQFDTRQRAVTDYLTHMDQMAAKYPNTRFAQEWGAARSTKILDPNELVQAGQKIYQSNQHELTEEANMPPIERAMRDRFKWENDPNNPGEKVAVSIDQNGTPRVQRIPGATAGGKSDALLTGDPLAPLSESEWEDAIDEATKQIDAGIKEAVAEGFLPAVSDATRPQEITKRAVEIIRQRREAVRLQQEDIAQKKQLIGMVQEIQALKQLGIIQPPAAAVAGRNEPAAPPVAAPVPTPTPTSPGPSPTPALPSPTATPNRDDQARARYRELRLQGMDHQEAMNQVNQEMPGAIR